jgi:hypothetical protein
MEMLRAYAKFSPGQIVVTSGARAVLCPHDVIDALIRHLQGDWGDVDEHGRRENEAALEHGFRLLSSYESENGTKFWIITKHDRSLTTILLPSEN